MSDIRQAAMGFIRDLCPSEQARAGLTETTPLLDAGILDSFGVVRLIQFMESEFGIRIPDADIGPDMFSSVASVVAYVEKKRAA